MTVPAAFRCCKCRRWAVLRYDAGKHSGKQFCEHHSPAIVAFRAAAHARLTAPR